MSERVCRCIPFKELSSLKSDELTGIINEIKYKLVRINEDIYSIVQEGKFGPWKVGEVLRGWWHLGGAGWTYTGQTSFKKGNTAKQAAEAFFKEKSISLKSDELNGILIDSIYADGHTYQIQLTAGQYYLYKDGKYAGKWFRTESEAKRFLRGFQESKKEEESLDGIVVTEELARISPCIRIKGTDLVFTKGVVGALSKEQRDKYCPKIIDVERHEFKKRIARWSEAVKTCKERTKHLTGGDKVKAYIDCMSIEARKKE